MSSSSDGSAGSSAPRSAPWLWLSPIAFVAFAASLLGGGFLLLQYRPVSNYYFQDLMALRENWSGVVAVHEVGGLFAAAVLTLAAFVPRSPGVVRVGFAIAAMCFVTMYFTGEHIAPETISTLGETPPALFAVYLVHVAALPFVGAATALLCFFLGLRAQRT